MQKSVLYQYLQNQRFRQSEEDYSCARVFRKATEWLDDNASSKPFFLWVEAFDPHEPWDPPKRFADLYCPDYNGLDFILPGEAGQNASPEEIERIKALYMGEVTFVDEWVGRFLSKIEEMHLKEDTLILVLSDHGTQVQDHGGFGKGATNLRTYITQIVWQMRLPGQAQPRQINALVQTHDVMPTLLDILGVPYSRAEGKSVMPLVENKTDVHREPIVIGWAQSSAGNARAYVSVRNSQWNYFTAVHERQQDTLFNLEEDPGENENVGENHPGVVKELKAHAEALLGQRLPARLNEVCDPAPSPIALYLSGKDH